MNLENIYGTFFKTQKTIIDLVVMAKAFIFMMEKRLSILLQKMDLLTTP